jgi:hypothetical protein
MAELKSRSSWRRLVFIRGHFNLDQSLFRHRGGRLLGDKFLDGVILARAPECLARRGIRRRFLRSRRLCASEPSTHFLLTFQGKTNICLRRVLDFCCPIQVNTGV